MIVTTSPVQDQSLEAEAREAAIQAKRAQMEAQFKLVAEGMPWYEGTGNDDPIMPHQWFGACYGAAAKRWFLGDVPGAGKTRTSVAWLDLTGSKKVVIVAEANVCEQFAGEVMDLAPHRTIINLAKLSKQTRHERLALMARAKEAVVVINYEMFRADKKALAKIMMWQADSIIVDEGHNMKSIQTTNFKYVRDIVFAENSCPKCAGLVFGLERPCPNCGWKLTGTLKEWHQSAVKNMNTFLSSRSMKNVLIMTGTPILNDPVDLFAIFHLISPVRFPSQQKFKNSFTHPDYSQKRSVFSKLGLAALTPMLKGRYLARKLEDVGIILPTQHVHVERVELDPKEYPLQARTIEQVAQSAIIELSNGAATSIMHVISIILRKRQANVWPGGITFEDEDGTLVSVGDEVNESVKMDAALARIKAYHAQGNRQVVFSQFQTALAEFEKRVAAEGIRVARFDGSTPTKRRTEIKNNFYKAKGEDSKWDVVLVHYRTGGAGLNLTAATVTHILDEEWNAGRRDQAYARTRRVGQDQETHVHIYRIPGTVDTWMANLIRMKEKLVDSLGKAMTGAEQTSRIRDAIMKGEM